MSLAVGTSAAASGAPNAPTGLTATGSAPGTISLSWTAPSSGPAPVGYQVFEGTSSGDEGTLLNPNVLIAGTSTTVTVASGTKEYFVVVAVDAAGASGISNESSATAPNSENPPAPTGVTATKGYNSATLSWSAISTWNDGVAITPTTLAADEQYQIWDSTASGAEGLVATVPGNETSYYLDGLTNGTPEYFVIKALNHAGNLSAASSEVSVTPGTTVPNAPTSLSGTLSGTSVDLSWTAVTGDATGGDPIADYNVYEGTTSGGESSTPVDTTGGTTATVSGLTAGDTYYFTVKATTAAGTSAASQEYAVSVIGTDPAAPTNLAASGSYASANLTWSAPTSSGDSPISYYDIYYSTTAADANSTLGTPAPDNGGAITSTSDTVTGLSATVGTQYYFAVYATNADGYTSPASLVAGAVTANTSPSAPTGLYGTNTSTSITLNWTAGNAGSANTPVYTVNGAPSGSTVTVTGTSATITGLTSGSTYSLSVTESTGIGTPATSSTVSIRTNDNAPDTPTGLTGTATSSSTATLSWNAPANQGSGVVTSYNVYENGQLMTADVTFPTATTAAVTALTPGDTYSFTVQAVNSNSIDSNQTPSVTVVPNVAPLAPTSVSAVSAGPTSVTVSWSPASTGTVPTSYDVQESQDGGATYFPVATNVQATSYTVTGLSAAESYLFEVRADNAYGDSGYTVTATAVSPGAVPPTAPTGLSVSESGSLTSLNWTAPSSNGGDAIEYYEIYRSATVAVDPSAVGADLISNGNGVVEVPAGTTSATVVSGVSGVDYYYQVVAVSAAGASAGSNVVNSTKTSGAVPAAPNAPFAADAGNGAVLVNWTAPANNGSSAITGYVLTWYVNGAAVGSTSVTGTSDTVTGLKAGTQYTFTVSAVNATGASAQSSFSNAVTVAGATVAGQSTAQKNASDKKWATASAEHLTTVNLSKLAKGTATVQSYAGLGGGKTSESLYVTVGKKKTLVATASHTFSKIGHATLKLKLTKAGKTLMKSLTSAKKKATVTVTGKVVSTPKGLSKQTITKSKKRKA